MSAEIICAIAFIGLLFLVCSKSKTLVINRLNDGPLTKLDFVSHWHQLVLHFCTHFGAEL